MVVVVVVVVIIVEPPLPKYSRSQKVGTWA